MGKFNSGGVEFTRTIQDVIEDYASFLLEQKLITEEEFYYYIGDGKDELLDVLIDKLYETEEYRGVTISTLDAFYHFCRFIIYKYNNQEVWNKFVKEMFLDIERHKDICDMASRSLGKSFNLFTLYPIFKMFLHAGTKFLHVSNIPQQIVENLRITKDVIDHNEVLYAKKAVWKGKDLKWTERQIEYNDGMLITLSAGTSPRGLHVNYAIIDDIVTEGAQLSDDEMENYIFGQIYPTVQRMKGRLIVTGTPLHRKDLYHLLMGDKPDFEGDPISDGRISHKGFYCKMYPIMDENGEPFLPEIYGKEEIEKIREKQGEIKFQREYMLNCIDESLTMFSPHLIASVSDGEEKYEYSSEDRNRQFVIGVDVATSGAASADFSAFVVLEIKQTDKGKKKIIRHLVHAKGMDVDVQVETIVDLAKRFGNARVVVEKNNVGVALVQGLARQNINIESVTMTRPFKDNIIRYLVNEMKNKNLWFPEETEEIHKIKNELLNFGVKTSRSGVERMEALTGHDDIVMALAIANDACQDLGSLPFAILR